VIGPSDPIRLPRFAGIDPLVEPEGELAIVISRAASRITEDQALDHVLGLTIANDITARRWQTTAVPSPWMRGKGFDTFCPIGPAVVTLDAIADVDALDIRTTVNGRTVREGSSGTMIRRVRPLISALSAHVTLVPGTVILAGGPPRAEAEARPLEPGDEVAVEIEGIGRLENTVAPEPDAP
jgi:2-keto-4-pentenoate hydratase/2-oxohepta-3-ene-1,7-dioic acid hydratase in catechol pathway